jgi:hypothetical protein
MKSLALDPAARLGLSKPTANGTFGKKTLPATSLPSHVLLPLLLTIVVVLITYQCFHYFTSQLPPFNTGLKRLPGPRSTLPYLGCIHDVDRMQAWTAMHKFSQQYNRLFSCTLGGETHLWVAREDAAQDLLVKHVELSSARADLGAFPGVTKDFKYLPLLGYTETYLDAASVEPMLTSVDQSTSTVSADSRMP